MMAAADQRITNQGLLNFNKFREKTDSVYSLVDAIAVERPLRDMEEASAAAHYVNNVLAFVEYGVTAKTGYENSKIEPVMEGIGEIIKACSLVSLRVEQYIDLQQDMKK